MENDLHQAFYSVFCSSKEIIKNNQRHLYVNMLDLLGRTCRATGLAESKIGADNLVQFWIENILPLVFDNDKTIQTCAVNAMEQGLSLLEVSTIHGSKHWPDLRENIVTTLPDKIHQLRTNKNKHWHQIWCLVIRILDREILNGASVINSFLSTVELGFRSSDCNVRAETFLCWRLLIKIFHYYNELLTPKRLKLICIPLKSTQSKSASLSNVKIRVWWYFITCIGEKLSEHFSKVVDPFLTYAFGSLDRNVAGDAQQYESVKIISVLCLSQILLEDRDKLIDILISENNLETLIQPSPLLSPETLREHWKPITHAVLNAVQMLAETDDESENHDAKQHLRNWMVLRLVKIMLDLNYAPCTQEVCKGLIKFLPAQTLPLNTALNCIASNGINIMTSKNDIENFSEILNSIMSLLIAGKSYIPTGVLQRCIEQISKTVQLFEREQTQLQALCAIIKVVCNSKDDDYETFEIKLIFWKRLAQTIITYLSENNLLYRRKDFAEIINSFILWPLCYFVSFTECGKAISLNDDFCALWRQLLLCGQNSPDREKFLHDVQKSLKELIESGYKELPLSELVNAYVIATLKIDSGKNSTNINDILLFLCNLFELPNITATKSFEAYLNTLYNVFLHMKNEELCEKFELVKSCISHVVGIVAKEKPSNVKVFNDWKQKMLERFRTLPQKNYLTQIREIFKNDVFVIIPSVWVLNPEKLTEMQKEHFAERSDIPALYNDMSQSQDSSIKPWTPNKIVIAKKDKTEIAISSSQADNDEGLNKSKNSNSDTSPTVEMRCTRRRSTKVLDVLNENNRANNSSDNDDAKANIKNTKTTSLDVKSSLRTRKSLRSNNRMDDVEQKEKETATLSEDMPTISKQTGTDNNEEPTSDGTEKSNLNTCSALLNTQKNLCNQETQPNTETLLNASEKESSPEEVIPESQTQSTIIISEPIAPDLETSLRTDSMEMNLEPKELSPKKSTQKIVGLSSPPDRKSTNNSCSPSLRPKPTPHLTRGAQLINMIRSKMKVDSSSTASSNFGSNNLRFNNHSNRLERREGTPVPEGVLESVGLDHTSTPLQKKKFLTFSKRLPSPSASPSASILKRKLRRDSFDDISADSPAIKRKRVSFHDPPVSVTKEYVRDDAENQAKPKRCLALDKVSEIKNALRRRSKIDSMVEIGNFSNEHLEKQNLTELSNCASTSSARKISLDFEDQNNGQALSEICQPSNSLDLETHTQSRPDAETALDVVIQEFSLETVLERYFSSENTASTKAADTLAKFVSKCITTSSRVKTSVLEVLSENHSKDFLDHAVQENLSSVVCDRLNLDSVIDYICAKSKLNTNCRNSLLGKIPEVLKYCKADKEQLKFIMTLIEENLNPSDETILELISFLMRIRNERQSSSTPEMDSTDVSSSNL